jgi:hypothetical protein
MLHYSILVLQFEWILRMERTFPGSKVKDDILHRGKNFQTESNIGAIEDDLLLDGRTGWIHEVTCEIKMAWLEGGSCLKSVVHEHQYGKWVDVGGTIMIWLEKGCGPRSALDWE